MRGKRRLSTRERNIHTGFRDDTVGFDLDNFVKCQAHIWTAQRLEVALVSHNPPASERCKFFTVHTSQVFVESQARTVCRNDKMLVFRRCRLLYVVHRNLGQSKQVKRVTVLKILFGSYLSHNFGRVIVAFPFENEEGHLVLLVTSEWERDEMRLRRTEAAMRKR